MTEGNLLEQIRRRAYELWLSEGCPHGRDRIHWLRAEAELREKLHPLEANAGNGDIRGNGAEGGRHKSGRKKQRGSVARQG
jgi:DUF2934 family protein